MVNQEQAAGDTPSTLVYQFSMKKTYRFVRAQCLTNSCFCVVCQITAMMSCEEERERYAQQRYAIQFLHRQEKNCIETLHAIQKLCGEEAVSRAMIYCCYDAFEGKSKKKLEEGPGAPIHKTNAILQNTCTTLFATSLTDPRLIIQCTCSVEFCLFRE